MSWASEVRGKKIWYPNPYRFKTRKEAESFADDLKAKWVPLGFVEAVNVFEAKKKVPTEPPTWIHDPVNARWDDEKKDVFRLTIKAVEEAVETVVEAADDITEGEEDSLQYQTFNEIPYRGRSSKKLPRRIDRALRAAYEDETQLPEMEDMVLLSSTVRHDLRHMIAHGQCRYGLSRKIFDLFMDAHGRAPVNMHDLVCWLNTSEGHAGTGWFSFHEWRGNSKILKTLTMIRDEEIKQAKLKSKEYRARGTLFPAYGGSFQSSHYVFTWAPKAA